MSKHPINIKRVYKPYSKDDGKRVLIDRLWPRGLSKAKAHVDEWLKDIAPSTELRKWFNHEPAKWDEFQKRYKRELDNNQAVVKKLQDIAKSGKITIIYGAKDELHNDAVVLKNYLED